MPSPTTLTLLHKEAKKRVFLQGTVYLISKRDVTLAFTRKYPLRGYILGVLTHTTALDRLWGGDETLTMWF